MVGNKKLVKTGGARPFERRSTRTLRRHCERSEARHCERSEAIQRSRKERTAQSWAPAGRSVRSEARLESEPHSGVRADLVRPRRERVIRRARRRSLDCFASLARSGSGRRRRAPPANGARQRRSPSLRAKRSNPAVPQGADRAVMGAGRGAAFEATACVCRVPAGRERVIRRARRKVWIASLRSQ